MLEPSSDSSLSTTRNAPLSSNPTIYFAFAISNGSEFPLGSLGGNISVSNMFGFDIELSGVKRLSR